MTRENLLTKKLEQDGLIAIGFYYKKINFVYKDRQGMFFDEDVEEVTNTDVEFIQNYYRGKSRGDDDSRNMLALASCVSKNVGVIMRLDDAAYEQYKEAYNKMIAVLKNTHVVCIEAVDGSDAIEVLIKKDDDSFCIETIPLSSLKLVQEYYKDDEYPEFKTMLRFMDMVNLTIPEGVVAIGYQAIRDNEAYEQYKSQIKITS